MMEMMDRRVIHDLILDAGLFVLIVFLWFQ